MRIPSILLVSALSFLAVACGNKTGPESLAEAQSAIHSAQHDKAVAAAEKGLASHEARKDPALAWRLEQARLDGLAGGGKGKQVATELDRLGTAYPKQVTPALYRALADKLAAGGDAPGAIDLLTAAGTKFPAEKASFDEAIETLKANADPATVERLKSLGYL